ncbi:MAG: CPBP family intramembrane glutamic endopeptidase [Gemmatimonadota bacterium]
MRMECPGTPTRRPYITTVGLVAVLATVAAPVEAQDSTGVAVPAAPGARWGSEFVIPLASTMVPGLGQYIDGAYLAGAAYTGAFVAGVALGPEIANGDVDTGDPWPRAARDQAGYQVVHSAFTAQLLSGWDAFQRAVPALQRDGKYDFLTTRENVGDLLTAPFDMEFLGRPTTWAYLAYTGVVTGIVLAHRESGTEYEPFRPHDAGFAGALSYNAGVGEEALFRGWLLPMLHQKTGQRFWLANGIQASLFGRAHGANGTLFHVLSGLYKGWVTQRNDWSIRESIFHHFWYDVAVVTATLLVDERAAVQLTFPAIRF